MPTRGNYNGKLSEKDQLIKSLRDKKINRPELKKDIDKKIKILEGNKTIEK